MLDDNEKQVEGQKREPSLIAAIWRALRSTRTTWQVLMVIAAVATIGEIIPQHEAVEYYTQRYAPWAASLILNLHLDRLYGSVFFCLLLAVLLLNLLACAGRAWRRAWAQFRGPNIEAARRLRLEGEGTLSCRGSSVAAGDAAAAALRARGYRLIEERAPDGEVCQVGRKHQYAAFGTILTHYSIFVLAVGAIMGIMPATSLDTTVVVNEGETVSGKEAGIGFDIALHKFELEYNAGSSSVSRYTSDVGIVQNGLETQRGLVRVNHPMQVGSVGLFQQGWGVAGFTLHITTPKGEPREVFIPTQEAVDEQGSRAWDIATQDRIVWLTEGKTALAALAFAADAVVQNGDVVGSDSEFPRNPAVRLFGVAGIGAGATGHERTDLKWLMAGQPVTYKGYKITLGEVRNWSGIGLRRDLGLPFVWLGFIALMVGLMFQLYVQPRVALVCVRPRGKGAVAAVSIRGGHVNAADEDYRAVAGALEGKTEG